MKVVGKKIRREDKKEDLALVREMAYTRNQGLVLENKKKLVEKYEDLKNNIAFNRPHKWCVSLAPDAFYGLSITTSPTEKLNDLLKVKIPVETTMQAILKKGDLLEKELRQKNICTDKTKILSIFKDNRLKRVQ